MQKVRKVKLPATDPTIFHISRLGAPRNSRKAVKATIAVFWRQAIATTSSSKANQLRVRVIVIARDQICRMNSIVSTSLSQCSIRLTSQYNSKADKAT
jgi:hypothetical protein